MEREGLPKPKLLFVVSHDFGELSNVLCFLHGTDIDAHVLLPERLAAVNRGSLSAPAGTFRTLDDIQNAVREHEPRAVFLFSGYLFSLGGLLPQDAFERWLDELRGSARQIVTSDPFLGTMDRPAASTIHEGHPARSLLLAHFQRVAACLRETARLYAFCTDVPPGENRIRFFNPHPLPWNAARGGPARTPADPYWVFVLSAEDYRCQVGKHGARRFHGQLAAQLEHASTSGRHPVVLAPRACLDGLRHDGAAPARATLSDFCGFADFYTLVMNAEYAFYWNLFSQSVALRLVHSMPVFFLDQGHLCEALRPFGERGIRYHYGGVTPTRLDLASAWSHGELAQRAESQRESMEPVRQRVRRAPSPREIVDELMEGGGRKKSSASPDA